MTKETKQEVLERLQDLHDCIDSVPALLKFTKGGRCQTVDTIAAEDVENSHEEWKEMLQDIVDLINKEDNA